MSEGPGSVHVAYVRCDADRQDAVHQGDKATVPLVAPGPVNSTQDTVERDPAGQAQERTDHKQHHLLFYRQNKQEETAKTNLQFLSKTRLSAVIEPTLNHITQ